MALAVGLKGSTLSGNMAKMYRPALTLTNTSLVLFTALVLLMLLVLTLRTLFTAQRSRALVAGDE